MNHSKPRAGIPFPFKRSPCPETGSLLRASPQVGIIDDAAKKAGIENVALGRPAFRRAGLNLQHAVIVDVEATAPIRQAEAGAAMDMIIRTRERFGRYPEKLVADTAYGSAETLGWLVESEGIEPHIPAIDKTHRTDGTLYARPTAIPARAARSCSLVTARSRLSGLRRRTTAPSATAPPKRIASRVR